AQIELVRQVRLKLIAATEEQETASLSKAQISLNNAVQLSKDPKIKSQALFLIGLIGVYQNNSNLALMSFRDASNLDRTNPNYDQMQFYVAEIYFDRNQYKEAIGTYTEASQSKNAKLAILARYKLAWCHINQSQYDPAKKLLSGIIMSNLDANFREDALKDLAFLVTLYKSEQEIVDYANKEFPLLVSDKKQNEANEAKVAFLNNVYQILLSQGTNTDRPLILREILAWEKRPEYRIVTLTVNLKVHQRDFATHRASYDFDQILKELNQIKNPRDKNVSDIYSKVLEPELKRVANSYWNTYQKKVKSPEVIPDDVLIKRLNHFLDVYIYYFPESDSIIESMLLRMQICEKLNDPICVYKSAKQALTVDSLKKDFYKFRYALVGALAELNKSHPNYKSEYIRTNFEFLLGSTDEPNIKLPNSVTPDDVRKYLPPTEKVLIGRNEWLQVAKAFITILHNNREYSLAEPLIQKVVEMEGSAENQYRLTFNRYNQHKYILISQTKFSSESLSGDKELKEMVTSSLLNVINWKRSSLLGSLQPGQSSNTGPSQEDISALNSLSLNNLVQQFYDLKPKREDQLKVAAMVINLQLDDKSAATATTSSPFGNLTHQEKMSQNIFPTWKKYVLKLFQDGQFQTAYSELTPCAHHKDCPLILDGFYEAALALKKESSPEVISKLTETKDIANAELILDRLMLIDADGFQNFLNSLNKIPLFQASVKRFSRMKTMIDDANKLQQAPVDLSLDASKENDLLFAGYSPPPKSIFAKQIQLQFPNSSTPKQKIENILKGNINDVRFLRKKSVKAVQSLSYVDSVHLLRVSAMNEKRLAQAILASPVPDSL
ncbi:MAG TPA: hypothetical protein PLU50_03535, partial [Pseudobdellovibrionaceae bacterium]|nr:hypothetical protein [Pseudobdellovibrionaceae bacterium]